MERKKIMTWMLMWLNMSAAALNAMLQLLVIYRYVSIWEVAQFQTMRKFKSAKVLREALNTTYLCLFAHTTKQV